MSVVDRGSCEADEEGGRMAVPGRTRLRAALVGVLANEPPKGANEPPKEPEPEVWARSGAGCDA